MKFYNIQAVSQISGLSSHCIRAWEKRYEAIKPSRSENGRRLYSEAEVERLVKLAKLSMMGNSISLIANLSDSDLEALLEKMGKRIVPLKPSQSLVEPKAYLNNLMMALGAYKLDILTHELNKASMDLTCRDFAMQVIAELMRKVGEYVHDGRMSIAQEHTLSALAKFFIGRRISQHYRGERTGKKLKFTLATPTGEHHSMGLLIAGLLMAEHQIEFIYLGEDLPVESIADAANATDSDYVLLSVSPAFSRSRDINEISMKLKHNLKKGTSLWIGGAVDQLLTSTLRDGDIKTFSSLEGLDAKLAQIVAAE
jgi:DNA-binding transcriptional MerR regulator/methylmalonyl-CoA mutase cobalamin-binding subunit